ncbi:MAG: alpha/beta hydrolase [Acidobacteria bacterium]|nr:alpha/beta hydrolase [Acidobacteriota bacterium]
MSRTIPRARADDVVRVVAAALLGVMRSAGRRLAGKSRRRAWGFGLEVMIGGTRGAWSVMPRIGMVRWRNVGEAMSPLRTDGLPHRQIELGTGADRINAMWLEPPNASGAVLLYFHGGGFVFGSVRTHGPLIGALARASRARTLAIEYCLAPEHPAPAAVKDAVGAYRHLLAQGITPDRIVLAGDSAGGNLVLSTLLALRDAGDPTPAAAVAISPWVDLGNSGASFETNDRFDFVGAKYCRLAATEYLAGANPRSAAISPLFADLAELPPLLIHAGQAEVLVDQIGDFAARAKTAGVDVTFSVYEDMVHVWHLHRDVTPQAQAAIDEIGLFVQQQTASLIAVQPGG